MTVDHESYIREAMMTSIGKAGLAKQAQVGAGVWLVNSRDAEYIKLSEFYDVFIDQRNVDRVKVFVSNADLSRQMVAVWGGRGMTVKNNLCVVDVTS